VIATGRAYARAALAGNPSDGYGGAVLAVTVRDFAAEVDLSHSHERAVDSDAAELIGAAVTRFERSLEADERPYRIACRTTIPRQVGLAGSSAIVIATLRALGELYGERIDADELAQLAWRAEAEELGYPAGPQDRYAQAHEGLVLMDFSDGPRVERLDDAALPPLFVAFRADASEPSPSVHAELRSRAQRDETPIRASMSELAEHAREAGRRLRAGRDDIGELMSASFEVRRRIVPLDPRHERMVLVAREHGAYANYAGSGGAIVGTRPPGDAWPALRWALEAEGCSVIVPGVA
jgi:glucuronokinase